MAKLLLATDPGPPRTRGLLRAFLEAAGHDVHEVSDGVAALAEVDARAPEVLIVDTALPTLDGVQVLARLRRQAPARKLPIVVLSTLPAPLAKRLVTGLGAAVYLHKPFAFQALREAVDEALRPPVPAAEPPSPARAPTENGVGPHPTRLATRSRSRRRGAARRPAG
jgi:DNA-binding response OmpR family regulator